MRRTGYILALDLFLLTLCALGVYRFAQKAGFPAQIESKGNAVIIKSLASGIHSPLHIGDTVFSVDGQSVHTNDEIAFLCNQYRIGDPLPITCIRDQKAIIIPVRLTSYFTSAQIIIESIVGFLFFLIGMGVILFQKKENAARIFHHLCVSIAGLIFLTTGYFKISPLGIGYALELVFQAFFVIVAIFFIHFTLVFPNEKYPHKRKILFPLYGAAFALTIWAGIAFLIASYPAVDLTKYSAYNAANYAVRIFFIVVFFGGFGNIVHTYVISKGDIERRKLRWIFFGIIFGASSYIFLWVIPDLVIGRGLLDEEITLALSVVAPVSFAIAILRYRVFDINLLFKRSTVYAIVIGALLVVYLGIVGLLSHIAGSFALSSSLTNTIGALLVALLFEPLRKRVQKIVDKKFFRISYNFYEAQNAILEEIKFARTVEIISTLVTKKMNEILPVTRIGFFIVEAPHNRLRLVAHKGFDLLERRGIRLETDQLKTNLEMPVARTQMIEHGARFEAADETVFKRWGIAMVLPMLTEGRTAIGFLVLGEKLSDTRFTIEDVALANSVSAQSGIALERIALERKLILEQAESERLTELNTLKSYFVSSVSHDLRTPLTSIRMFAELLKEQDDLPRAKATEYLSIIEGEADRLSRLIANVLDFAKIEKGTKEYSLKEIDLNDLARDVIHSLEYQVLLRGFTVTTEISPSQLAVKLDRDAVYDAITNLITNAMKYSPPERKHIIIRTATEKGYVVLSVEDEGYGMEVEEKKHIFEPFYRIDNSEMKAAGGAGLGLSLVKHTMDAHNGRVEVQSVVGKGSIFALYFSQNH